MIEVALCIGKDHDPWLVLLAVFVCCTGAFATMQMFSRAQVTSGAQWLAWLFLTAVGAGATIWCTHFVAMLAFRAGVPVRLDPVLTIVSLIAAISGTGIGFGVATRRRKLVHLVVGGSVVGIAISGMHFTGMAAYRVDGLVEWRMPYVIASVLCAVVFSAAALAAGADAGSGACDCVSWAAGDRRRSVRGANRSLDTLRCDAAFAPHGDERFAYRPPKPRQFPE